MRSRIQVTRKSQVPVVRSGSEIIGRPTDSSGAESNLEGIGALCQHYGNQEERGDKDARHHRRGLCEHE